MSSDEHVRLLMMRRLDGLASDAEIAELDRHLEQDAHARAEWDDFRVTKAATDRMRDSMVFDDVLDEIQAGVIARLSRGTATGLMVAGLLVVTLFGLSQAILSNEVPMAIKVGTALAGSGLLLFAWETIRWKLKTHARDPYRHVVR